MMIVVLRQEAMFQEKKEWKIKSFRGEWIKGFNAGGAGACCSCLFFVSCRWCLLSLVPVVVGVCCCWCLLLLVSVVVGVCCCWCL